MSVKQIPEGYHTITPYFAVEGATKLLSFLKEAFGAEVRGCSEKNGIIFNAEVRIGTSMLMLADTRGQRSGNKAMMYLYVNDCDKVYAQAVRAGGRTRCQSARSRASLVAISITGVHAAFPRRAACQRPPDLWIISRTITSGCAVAATAGSCTTSTIGS